jgi:hypothetical protein
MIRRTMPSYPIRTGDLLQLSTRRPHALPYTLLSGVTDRHLAFEKIRVLGCQFALIRYRCA